MWTSQWNNKSMTLSHLERQFKRLRHARCEHTAGAWFCLKVAQYLSFLHGKFDDEIRRDASNGIVKMMVVNCYACML